MAHSSTDSMFLQELTRQIPKWRTNPTRFVIDAWGVRPDPWQAEALHELLAGGGRVSIRACHGPGKTATAAWSIFAFMATQFPTRVPCTAPSSNQLHDVLWAELAKWLGKMAPWMQTLFRLTSERLEWVGAPRESFAVARTARPEKPEALQGFHADNLLFVIDEASGVDEAIFEVAEGALSGENARVLMLANPTRTSGYFHASHHSMRHRWHCMRVSHTDSPRVSAEYVADMAAKYGEDSNVYRVRVLGEFATSSDSAVVPLDWVESAVGRQVVRHGDICWGLDVARFGDDRTALCKRSSNTILEPIKAWRGKDLMQTCGLVVAEYDATPEPEKPTAIYVDSIGLGSGVVDRLNEKGLPVVGVNVAEAPSVRDQHMRLRDELWWSVREWFEERDVAMPRDDDLIAEITLPGYTLTSSGKTQVEAKDSIKKRGLQSPDLADSLMLTFAHRYASVGRPHARHARRTRQSNRAQGLSGIV